jgi:hypothetical protein
MIARLTALLCLLALLAPSAALAQGGGAFDPLPPAPPEPAPAPQAPQDQQQQDDGLSSTQQILVGMAGIVLLFGIAWAILRDAKSAAPADARSAPALPGEKPQPKGSQRPAGVRHRQNRQKAKAARQARKKARKR